MSEQIAEVLERHLGACGRFGLPCAEVRPRDEWCGRCDIRACIMHDLAPLIAERESAAVEARVAAVERLAERWGFMAETLTHPTEDSATRARGVGLAHCANQLRAALKGDA